MASTTPPVERVKPPKLMVVVGNPVIRRLLSRPKPPKGLAAHLALLHLVGRRSGRRIDVPVGLHRLDGELLVLTSSGWRHNLRGGAEVEVTIAGRRQAARAELIDAPGEVAEVYRRLIEHYGLAQAGRRLGIRISVDRMPTREELEQAVRNSGLAVVRLTLAD